MKKKFLYLLLFVLISPLSFGNVSFILKQHYVPAGSQVTVPVRVKDFLNIVSFQGTLQFDQTKLSFVSVQDFGLNGMNVSGFGTSQTASGKLTFSWIDGAMSGVSLPDSSTIFSVKFNVIGSNGQVAALSFVNSPTSMEVINSAFNTVPVTLVSGAVHIQNTIPSGSVTFKLDSVTGTQSSQLSVSLRSTGFTNIISAQGTIQFDATKVTYAGISYFGIPGMNSGNFGVSQIATGKLTFSWFDASLNGLNMASGAPLFSILFNLTGNAGTQTALNIVNSPTPLEVIDSSQNQIPASTVNGRIGILANTTQQTLRLKIDSVAGPNGSQVVVPVRAWHFRKLISMQGTISFNTSVATYASVEQFGLAGLDATGFGTSQTGNGKLMFAWSDPAMTGQSLADSAVLFAMRFNIVGSPSSITSLDFVNSPTPLEFIDTTYSAMGSVLQPGRIRVNGGSGITTFNPTILNYCAGNAITVNYTISGTFNAGNWFILQLSDATGSFASPTNIDTLVSTAAGTFTTNLPSSLTGGTLYRVRVISTNPQIFGLMNTSDINISTTPVMAATPTGATSVCQGSVSGIYTTTGSTGAATYQWDIAPPAAGTTTSTNASATINWSGTYTGNVSIKVRGINSCATGTYSNILSVVINPIPATPVVNVADSCGSSVLSTTAGGSLLWSPGGETTSQITVTTIGIYTVTQTLLGCASLPGSGVAAPLSIPATPVVNVNDSCGHSVLSTNATGNLLWSPGGQTVSSINVTTAGTYSVTQTSGGCSSLAGSGVAAPIATPVVSLGNDTTLCADQSVVLNAGNAGAAYAWLPGGQTSQTVILDSAGLGVGTHTITVQVTMNTCAGSSAINITFTPCTGIDEIADEYHFGLLPNPSNGLFSISTEGMKGNAELIIYNMNGQAVYTEQIEVPGIQNPSIDLRGMAKGLYFVRFANGEKLFGEKLVIE